MNTLLPDNTNMRTLFFIPQAYNFTVRIKTIPRYLSWLFINLFTTTYYALLPLFISPVHTGLPLRTVIATLSLTLGIHYLYEYGYIYNDAVSTRLETNPTSRLTPAQLRYFTSHSTSVTLSRITGFIICMLITCLALPSPHTLCAIAVATLCPILFLLYNHWRSHCNVLLYLPLVASRFLPFAWLSCHDITPVIAVLIVLVYPLEIWLERFSIEKYRFRFIRKIISGEQDKPRFRAIYYIFVTSLVAIFLHHCHLTLLLLLPFILFTLYRVTYWITSRNRPS